MKSQTVELAGLTGIGRTKRIAQRDLERQIEEALAGDYSPRLVEFKGRQCIIWRTPTGIVSVNRQVTDGAIDNLWSLSGTCHHGRGETMDNAEKQAALHLAMLAADITSNEPPDILCRWPSVLADYRSWLGFQRAFRNYIVTHGEPSDLNAHKWACENGPNFAPSKEAMEHWTLIRKAIE